MGFFQNLKNKLGIGGVKVNLKVPPQIQKDASEVSGKVVLTTKSEQEVLTIEINMTEDYSKGRGENKKTKTFELGELTLPGGFTIKPGEVKEIEFTLPFAVVKSRMDELKEEGGALGTLGKVGSFASNEQSEYFIEAEVDVKAAALDPSDKVEVDLV